jgi:hypothetical protein
MGVEEMRRIGAWIDEVLSSGGDEAVAARVRREVEELCTAHPLYEGWLHRDFTQPSGLGPRELLAG